MSCELRVKSCELKRKAKRRRAFAFNSQPATRNPQLYPAEAGNADEPTAATPPAAAMLPSELLQPGEIIILLIKPSPWFILLESLRTLFILLTVWVAAVLLENLINRGPSHHDLGMVLGAVAAARLFWQFLEWLGRTYVLTDRRVIRVRGVLRVHVFETSLKNVQNTSTYISVRERIFGLGTIGFATAGTGPFEVHWHMVAHPTEVHQTIVEAMNRYR